MDVFSRTFLPATAEAGIPLPMVSRHMPILRRCVDPGQPTILVTRCLRPEHPLQGQHLLLLTQDRLVVTRQTRLLRRVRLHLNAGLRELVNVAWTADPRLLTVELVATASDGLRERFCIRPADPEQVRHVDALLGHLFPPHRPRPARPTQRQSRVPARHAA